MYLFDTDVLSATLKPRPPAALLRRLAHVPAAEQHVSTMTIAEIVYGACRSTRPAHFLRQLTDVLLPELQVVDFDAAAAFHAGRLRAELEGKGVPLPWPDLQIAAICLARDLTLVTANTRHFVRVPGLRVENWLA